MIVGISGLLVTATGEPVGTAGAGKDTFADFLVSGAGHVKVALADPLKRICRDVYRFTDEQLWGPSQMRNQPDTRYPRPHTWKMARLQVRMQTHLETFSCACCGQKVGRNGGRPDEGAATQCYLTPRYALQLLGTEWGRECYPETWVNYAVNAARDLLDETDDGGPRWCYDARYGLRAAGHQDRACKGVAIPDVRFKNEIEGLRSRGAKLVRVKRIGVGLVNAAGMHPSERESTEIPDSAFDVVIDNNGTMEDLSAQINHVLLSV